ncbi:MAG: hypothetical protein HC788_04560 [Sphingopyxis sp.]|nr:hypothetical protein [Sphingopyxis sp.]
MKHSRGRAGEREDGFALLVVISFLLISASIATPYLAKARTQALLARNQISETNDRLLVSALVQLAAFQYADLQGTFSEELPSKVSCVLSTATTVTFTFQDHSGLVDLNASDGALLELGFRGAGLTQAQAKAMAGEVSRFRYGPDTLPFATNARETAVLGGYKGGSFEALAELQDIDLPGDISLDVLRTLFTIQSGNGTVDVDFASPRLRLVIGQLDGSEVPFLVAGSRRFPALSVTVGIESGRQFGFGGSAVFVPVGTPLRMKLVEPVRMSRRLADEKIQYSGDTTCPDFFTPELLEFAAELAA